MTTHICKCSLDMEEQICSNLYVDCKHHYTDSLFGFNLRVWSSCLRGGAVCYTVT